MLSNLKERLNSAVQNLAENERIRALQASRHAANTTPPSSAGPARLSFGSKDENTPLALSLRSPSTDSMSELAITNCANDLDTIIKELELANASNEEILSQLYLSIEKVNKPTDISKTEPAPEILTEADDVIVSEESVVAKVYTEDVQNPTEETAETEEKGEDKQDVKSINGETVEGDVKLEEVEVIQGESEMIKVEELRNLHEKLSQLSQKQTKWMTTLKNISSEVKRLEKEREESWKREKQTETLYRALEDKLKQKHNEWQGVTTKLTETSQALQQKTNQQNKSERDIKDLTKERDSLSNRVNDLAKEKANWRQEKSKFEEDLKSTKAELETVKKVVEEQAKSIKQGEQDISLLKTRNSVLDEENTTSRRLFSEKSDEYERVLSQLNQVEQLMRINADKSDREVTRLSERMKNSQRDLDQMTAAYQKLEISSSDELNRLKEQLSGLLEQLEGAQNELLLLKELKLSLEENASTQAGEITELKAALALQTKNMVNSLLYYKASILSVYCRK